MPGSLRACLGKTGFSCDAVRWGRAGMLRVLIYDPDPTKKSRLRLAVDVIVAELGARNYGTACVASPQDLVTVVDRMRPGFYDIIVCLIGSADASQTLAALRKVREMDHDASIVIVADSPAYAGGAIGVGAEGYSLVKDGGTGLARVMESPVGKAVARRSETVGLRTDAGIGNVAFDDILFAESSKKGPILHIPPETTMVVRGTLQGLFETLSVKDSFIKAGNSFIINLESVRSVGEKSVIFANGESIIVPVRARKPVKDAFWSYCLKEH